ncbi:hypothetical protein AB0K74_36015 [Streptomyces sp. NPDC056159]|uniref:hypothetical protein n=1 Tax=Streptomyces sp. NPDC056159 TaxID=3155537 RepID=UPI0034459F11
MDANGAALIAAGAAVLASVATGLSTALAARIQARASHQAQLAQLNHAKAQDRHLQRRAAYAEFVKSVGVLHAQLADMVAVAGSPTAFNERQQLARADRAVLMSATHVAFLEGPAAVGERVRDLYNSVDRYWAAVGRLHTAACGGDSEDTQDRRQQMISIRNESRRLRDLFVEAARGALEAA